MLISQLQSNRIGIDRQGVRPLLAYFAIVLVPFVAVVVVGVLVYNRFFMFSLLT